MLSLVKEQFVFPLGIKTYQWEGLPSIFMLLDHLTALNLLNPVTPALMRPKENIITELQISLSSF